MPEYKTRMEELFKKYLDNQCSPEEVRTLLAHFNSPENEIQLRGLINDSLETIETANEESQWQPATDNILDTIKKQLNPGKGKIVPLFRRTWIRVAAAVILLVGGYFLYNSIKSNVTAKQEIAKTDTTTNNNEIGPGGNKAILTLADGSTINLESAVTETLTQQGNTTLLKSDGQLTYKSLNEKPAQIFLNNVTTPRGGQYQLTLSDGSKVWLNAASSIDFPVAFTGNERTVKITGEVYFEVAKNASMPFKVKIADKAEVEVLGTHFNINAYSDEATIKTTLLEGSVKVTGLSQNNSSTIIPGEQAQLSANNKINVNKIENVEDVIAWKNGTFNFDNADLETSLRQIARWYDVDIIFEGEVPNKKFSGEMQRVLSLHQVIKLLEKNNVYCRIEGKKLIVLK